MAGRINTIMQTCYFAISGVLPKDEAIAAIKYAIKKTYGKRGDAVVQRNYDAVDGTLENLIKIDYPDAPTSTHRLNPIVPENAPDFVQRVTALMLGGKGDLLPVSAFPVDGVWPTGTTQWEKRNIAEEIPVWETDLCIQCNKCAIVCPHAAIRPKVYHARSSRRRARHLQIHRVQGPRISRHAIRAASRAGGLHRLPTLRAGLPGQGQEQPEPQGHQHGRRNSRCAKPSAKTSPSSSICPIPTARCCVTT